MRIIAHRTLNRFAEKRARHRDAQALKAALDAWYAEVRKASWSNMATVKKHYATASVISADRVVFNIKGNSYRLVAAIDFEKFIVFIKWLGTHADYDRIDVENGAVWRLTSSPSATTRTTRPRWWKWSVFGARNWVRPAAIGSTCWPL